LESDSGEEGHLGYGEEGEFEMDENDEQDDGVLKRRAAAAELPDEGDD